MTAVAGPALGHPNVALAATGITKSFAGVEVLHGVDFALRRGETHGLVGQNGAGKSTLVKILNGAYTADGGTIEIDGVTVTGRDRDIHRSSTSMVFQEFSLFPAMSVGQNILLTREPLGRFGLVDDREVRRRAREALGRIGADIDPDEVVERLPVGSRQLVEIAKAISADARILILDEPTASLSHAEITALTDTIRRLTADGISIIYISHHLEEVVSICDRITVLRDGHVAAVANTSEITLTDLIDHMLGRSLESALVYEPTTIDRTGTPLLEVTDVSTPRLDSVTFALYRGEILGVAGLLGSGRTELARALFGVDPLLRGEIRLDGTPVDVRGPNHALRAGIALVPEDRARAGLVRDHSVFHNTLMASWRRYARAGFVDDRSARAAASALSTQLSIRAASLDQGVRGLSGGNQQKVVVAKNLSLDPDVLLLDEPTVGVDVGSKREILLGARDLARSGKGILLISSEFEELSAFADRVLVMSHGSITGVLDRAAGDDLSEGGLSRAVQG